MASAKFAKSTVNHSQIEVANEEERGNGGAHFDDEHDGIAALRPRIELRKRVANRAKHDLAIEKRTRLWTAIQAPPRKALPAHRRLGTRLRDHVRMSFLAEEADVRRSVRASRPEGT